MAGTPAEFTCISELNSDLLLRLLLGCEEASK